MSEKKNKTTNLIDLGPQLPLGVNVNGQMHKTIEIKKWTMAEEKSLGKLQEKYKNSKMGKYVALVLAQMCRKLGPWNFEDENKKLEEKMLCISQMFSGDVFYAYCWLRYKTMGKELPLIYQCPKCSGNSQVKFVANLETLPVVCGESEQDFRWEYKLNEPFTVRNRKIERVLFGPTRWNTYELFTPDEGQVKFDLIKGAFVGLADKSETSFVLAESEWDNLVKKDLETIVSKIEQERLGPDMSVDFECPKGHEIKHSIPWGYNDFFGVSSQ